MMQRVLDLEGGTKFTLGKEEFIRLSNQWVHALYGGNDITPNAVRVRDGVLVAIRDDTVVTPNPKD